MRAGALAVVVAGLLLTAVLAVAARVAYDHNEKRLLALQTELTGSLLTSDLGEAQADLARVAGLAAEAPEPVQAFSAAMASYMAPAGPYATATLALVEDGTTTILDHLGAPSFRGLRSPAVQALMRKSAQSTSMVTTRATKGHQQRLGYLVSAHGHGATFVVSADQQFRADDFVNVPRKSPDANLDFALYFGPTTAPGSLVFTNVHRLPLGGDVAKDAVTFGDNVLTLVASPRVSLAGAWSEYIPLAVAAGGLFLSLAAAVLANELLRRRDVAESQARVHRRRYERQRSVSEDLQHALLPKTLPFIPGLDLAARYIPGTRDIEVGGDWYTVVPVDDKKVVFIVGDVSGHDSAAAGMMASLRYGTRTLARMGMSPVELLAHATTDLELAGDEHFATVLVGSLDTARQELTLASAGHPPPLVFTGERAEFVELLPGVPLGMPGPVPQARVVPFGPGSVAVAFTDGLVERRGEDLEEGLRRLVAAASSPGPTAERLIDQLLVSLVSGDHEDDIAALVVRFVGTAP